MLKTLVSVSKAAFVKFEFEFEFQSSFKLTNHLSSKTKQNQNGPFLSHNYAMRYVCLGCDVDNITQVHVSLDRYMGMGLLFT